MTLLTTVIPYWFRQNILRRKGKPGNGHSTHHYSFDTPLTLKGLLPPAYDETTHYRRSLAQLRSKETPLEKYIVSTQRSVPGCGMETNSCMILSSTCPSLRMRTSTLSTNFVLSTSLKSLP